MCLFVVGGVQDNCLRLLNWPSRFLKSLNVIVSLERIALFSRCTYQPLISLIDSSTASSYMAQRQPILSNPHLFRFFRHLCLKTCNSSRLPTYAEHLKPTEESH